jgi:hypothetical protein
MEAVGLILNERITTDFGHIHNRPLLEVGGAVGSSPSQGQRRKYEGETSQ